MSMLYIICKTLTLPGAYIKTFWEHLTCRLLGIPVESTDYLHFNEVLGHVEHEFPKSMPRSFLFCWLPGFINRLFGIPMAFAGALGIFYLGVEPVIRETGKTTWLFFVYLIMLYLGLSLLNNVFPMIEDAVDLWDRLYGKNSNANIVWKILLFVPAACMLAGSYAEQYALSMLLTIVAVVVGIFL